MGLQERILIKLENIDHHPLDVPQNLNIFLLYHSCQILVAFVGEEFVNISSGKTFIWSKIYRVVNHSLNMCVVEISVGNFLEK